MSALELRWEARFVATLPLVMTLACDAPAPELPERTGRSDQRIINGIIDTEHPAAIAFGQGGLPFASCSGTIIQVRGNQGWALTAAHCASAASGAVVMLGHLDEAPRQFPIVEVVAHPDYDASFHSWWNDYAVVRFLGADDSLPVVPVATPAEDALSLGDAVTLVGYGRMEGGGSSPQRRSIARLIDSLAPDTFMYDQATGGICFGDSGGPAIAELPAGERVVGVTTVVSDDTCAGWGGSARASAYFDAFIHPLLEKPSFGSCFDCFGSALGVTECRALLDSCFVMGSPCESYSNCSGGCADVACQQGCAAAYPEGAQQYAEMMACPCDVCGSICEQEPICGGAGDACGMHSDADACSSCIDGCCSEARACVDDPNGCGSCFPNCDANAASDGLWACLDAGAGGACISSCGLDLFPPSEGGGGAGGGGEGGHGEGAGHEGGAGGGPSEEGGAASSGGHETQGGGGADAGGGDGADGDDGTSDEDADDGCSAASHEPRPRAFALIAAVAMLFVGRRKRK